MTRLFILRKSHALDWQDIEHVNVKTYSTALSVCNIKTPKTGRQAEYTIQFGVPAALIFGDVSGDRFADHILWDERVQHLMGRITVELDPELDREYPEKRVAVVEIMTKNGKRLTHRQEFGKGEPENPMSRSELEDKFHRMASGAVNEEKRRQIIDFLTTLETKKDMTDLVPLLKAAPRSKIRVLPVSLRRGGTGPRRD